MSFQPVALVVEDAPELRVVLSAHLRQLGFEVTALGSGDKAADVAKDIRPDLVCLDLMLPGVCGLEVCERLREIEETAHTPILITSGRDMPQDRVFAELAGADEYLTKPIDPMTLAESVRRLMQRGRLAA